jgi:hypothetical protein
MKTNVKVILAAIGIAVLASPVAAQSEPRHHAAHSAPSVPRAYGSVTRAPAPGLVPGGGQIRLPDCVHVTFPQCGGS